LTTTIHPKPLWEETIPGGNHWSGRLRRGTALRLTDLQGGANLSALFFNAEQPLERYNMPDTLKSQHTAFLTAGHVCQSDMGRVLCSITGDSLGWHDTWCGVSDAAMVQARFGERRYQQHHNAMLRNGRDNFLVELAKWGLGVRDVVPGVNFFSKVVPDAAGRLAFVAGHSVAGAHVDLRFEMDTLVVFSSAPHPLDPRSAYAPADVHLAASVAAPVAEDDPCRTHCPQNGRAFINTERYGGATARTPPHPTRPSCWKAGCCPPMRCSTRPVWPATRGWPRSPPARPCVSSTWKATRRWTPCSTAPPMRPSATARPTPSPGTASSIWGWDRSCIPTRAA
jgi:urea carboxylase-associated protein 2